MKTTIKSGIEQGKEFYALEQLDTASEIEAIIEEFEPLLKPCLHCGQDVITIRYLHYNPKWQDPHCFYIRCGGNRNGRVNVGCMIQTMMLPAADDEQNIRETLNSLCNAWNGRPKDWNR